jgi:hypothetical protein
MREWLPKIRYKIYEVETGEYIGYSNTIFKMDARLCDDYEFHPYWAKPNSFDPVKNFAVIWVLRQLRTEIDLNTPIKVEARDA